MGDDESRRDGGCGGNTAIHRLATYGTLAPGRPNHHQLDGLEGRWLAGLVNGMLIDAGWGAGLGHPHQTVEVGYIFSPAYSRQGYATEAVRALLEVAFFELGARRVVARVDARNTASRALLERLGMRQEANLIENEWIKGELTSEVDYAVLAREWPKAHG